MIVVGDLHLKSKEPYKKSLFSFLNWLNESYPNQHLVLLGDCFDSSTPKWSVYSEFEKFLESREKITYIIHGNHEYSKIKGSALEGIHLSNKVKVFFWGEEIEIDGLQCLILPYIYSSSKEEYENLKGSYDYIFTHITPVECAFKDEGIQLHKDLKAKKIIHGHTHQQTGFINNGIEHIVVGVPLPTRHLEDRQEHKILKIDSDGIEEIKVPFYFEYETIEFGEEPTCKDNILNIKNAPSFNVLFEKYKDYYIRKEGTTLTFMGEEISLDQIDNYISDLNKSFIEFSHDQGIGKNIVDCFLSYA